MALRFSGRLSAVQAMPSWILTFTNSYLYSAIGAVLLIVVTRARTRHRSYAGAGRRRRGTFRITRIKRQIPPCIGRRSETVADGMPALPGHGIVDCGAQSVHLYRPSRIR